MNDEIKTAAACKSGSVKIASDAEKLAADKARVIAECKARLASKLAAYMGE